ncbi:FtsX-like permease family protein [Streptosporangium sp. DT93]|uniref:FtsX-like permease family protein n=1 Tax=Streptosporangium sp. DT93 TaxID=3393428 RepID=UPI003CF52961
MSALLAALRLSRRGIGRARARSALIMFMIGLPVMLLTAGLTWQATVDVNAREGLSRTLGTADAQVEGRAIGAPVRQSADGGRAHEQTYAGMTPDRALTEREVLSLFGTGSRALPWRQSWTGYRATGAYRQVDLRELDLRDPITTGMYELSAGRLPRTPREVAVSPELGLVPGTGITLDGAGAVTVAGVVERRSAETPGIVVLPGTVRGAALGAAPTAWLVDTPSPVTWKRVAEINRHGVAVVSRAVIEDPPPPGKGPADPLPPPRGGDVDLVVIALAATIVVLQVVFLTGPAFAVGIRRRRRELALIASQGGSPRHLRGVVLADGLTLGLAACVLGAAGGIGLAAALTPFFRHGPFEVPAGPIALVVLLGVASALLAALVPAVQASRAEPAEALAGRRSRVRDRRGMPVLGLVLLVGAAAVIVTGGVLREWALWPIPDDQLSTVDLLVSVLLGQLGMVLLTPWLVGVVARTAGRLPLPFRMAARDAARNRGRTAPAVTAVLVATTIFAATAVMVSSQSARARETYTPAYVTGTTVVSAGYSWSDPRPGSRQTVRSELRRTVTSLLPGVPVIEMGGLADSASRPVDAVVGSLCEEECSPRDLRRRARVLVGGADLLRYLLRGPDPAAEATLAAGKAVVFDPRALRDGTLTLTVVGRSTGVEHSVPAVFRRPPGGPVVSALLPSSEASRLGLVVAYDTLLVDPAVLHTTTEQERRLHEAVRVVTPSAFATVERGFRDDDARKALAIAALGAAILILGATFAATGLAAAESRPDRATLAAVGAPARTQRLLVAGQAGFIAGLGVATGIPAGLAAGVMAVLGMNARDQAELSAMSGVTLEGQSIVMYLLDVPWLVLGGVLVGLPLLAALVAGAYARTGVVFARRLA